MLLLLPLLLIFCDVILLLLYGVCVFCDFLFHGVLLFYVWSFVGVLRVGVLFHGAILIVQRE
jgi:hypothetical protein